jgi:hypothetical protein
VFVALGIRHAMRTRRIILSSVTCPALQYFSILSQKRHDFCKKKVIEHEMCVLIFYTTFSRSVSHSKKNFGEICSKMYIGLRVNEVPVIFVSHFNET